MKIKIILSVILVLVSIIGFTGCTNNDKAQETESCENVTCWEDVNDTW